MMANSLDSLSPHFLRASYRVAQIVSAKGVSQTELYLSLRHIPTEGLFAIEALKAGLDILVCSGLVRPEGRRLRPTDNLIELRALALNEFVEALLFLYIGKKEPIWFEVLVEHQYLRSELIPDEDLEVLELCIPDERRREAILLACAHAKSREAAAELGAKGEEFVAEQCKRQLIEAGRPELAVQVRRVSLVSDALGYDILAPSLMGGSRHLEVKATARGGLYLSIYLTRNEARQGEHDDDWFLVICRAVENDEFELVGWCRWASFTRFLPEDGERTTVGWGEWYTVRLVLAQDVLEKGLPPL